MNKYTYTVEKLTNTIECLATHPGDIRKRVTAAYQYFYVLNTDDFPPKYQKDWEQIIKELTKYEPILDLNGNVIIGKVKNTMRHMHNKTASKIAKKIYTLYWAVSENKQYM